MSMISSVSLTVSAPTTLPVFSPVFIITMKTGEKTGNVVGALTVSETDEIMLITNKGQMVRTRVKEIRETGRNTMGVKLMDLRNSEKLQAIAPVVSQVQEEAQTAEDPAEKS